MNGYKHTVKLWLAFGAIYILWGSNFLAIRYATEAMPPFLMMATRSLIAGGLLFAWAWVKNGERPAPGQWRAALVVGNVLFLGCHGALAWAQQTVPSGIASVVMATTPVYLILLDWASGGGRPRWQSTAGLVLGLLGLAILMGPSHRQSLPLVGPLVLVGGAMAWAAGSLLSRRLSLPKSLVLASGMQLLSGGVGLAVTGLALGEAGRLDGGLFAPRPLLSFTYMIVASSLGAFTAYMWLLRVTTPALAGTYAFVNPVVALFVGWALGGEALDGRTLWASAVIVAGVALIVAAPRNEKKGETHDRTRVEGHHPGGEGGGVSRVPAAHGRLAMPRHTG
jgi:drug/metabolite transporter (DMT)-like permease